MRRWCQFRLRTLLLAFLVLALALGLGRWLLQRYRVYRAVERALDSGPLESWATSRIDWISCKPPGMPANDSRDNDLSHLLSDLDRVTEKLVEVLETDDHEQRRINAVRTLHDLVDKSGSFGLRKRSLARLIAVATGGTASSELESALAETIARWIDCTPPDAAQRAAILSRARAAPPESMVLWASVLGEIGGRQEIMTLLEYGGTHDENLLAAIHRSHLGACRWPGMLPYLEQWLADPVVAPWVLESRCAILDATDRGRRILLAYATDASHPVPQRKQAMEQLQETMPGLELLLDAAKTPGTLPVAGDPVQVLQPLLREMTPRNDNEFWTELIDGLDTSYWLPGASETPEVEQMRQAEVDGTRRCLQILSGQEDLTTQEEWRGWHEGTAPPTPTRKELLQFVLDQPEMIDVSAVLRRVISYAPAGVPAECMPLYKKMLRAESTQVRFWACFVLQYFTSDTEAVPVVIDLIAASKPEFYLPRSSCGMISMLQQRFAVNFFWDADAWRRWWAEYSKGDLQKESL